MNTPILHILVIWSKAQEHRDVILSDLRDNFDILKVFKVHWDADKFLQNYMVFYAHSQYHLARAEYCSILQNKVEHCGADDFTVVILRDNTPCFEIRQTSSGSRLVNIRMFDKKTQYRQLTGGGHKIHTSDDAWETNHDLTLMFGLNTEDFLNHYTLDGEEESFSGNNLGIGGYDSIQQFFYVLNNCIRYVVMRNHECLPGQYTVEGHGDIDVLCENCNWMAYLTAAHRVFQQEYRVYHTIIIGGKEIPFDFRYVGDNYYDQPWQEDILRTRQLTKGLFYVPNPENQYYSLLYHAYIQKCEVKNDYLPKLQAYAQAIELKFNQTVDDTINQIDVFFNAHHYEYVHPKDKTVYFNLKNLSYSKCVSKYGVLIKRQTAIDDSGREFGTRVYEKEKSFVKVGCNTLINNEYEYLKLLSDHTLFPKIISREYDFEKDEAILEISRIEGFDTECFFASSKYQQAKYVKSFVRGCILLLKELARNKVAHRDFLPSNIIIKDLNGVCKVGLIDFGWATEITKSNINRPKLLAGNFATSKNSTDSYALGHLLLFYWYDLPYARIMSKMLCSVSDDDVSDISKLLKKYDLCLTMSNLLFSPYDRWRLFCRRHVKIGMTKDKILRNLERAKRRIL